MISVFTFTMGRELYLKRLIESIRMLGGNDEFEHHICFQGATPSGEFSDYLESLRKNSYPLITHFWDKNYGGCEGSNRVIPLLIGNLILKLDDDAILRSNNFFKHIETIHSLIPNSVFSPFPVGLIGNLGGIVPNNVNLNKRFVKYSEETDCYYTFRKTIMVGGFARIAPAKIIKKTKWPNENIRILEDSVFSEFCRIKEISMYYLENALIVEHQESTLGQEQRYGGRKMRLDIRESESPKISIIVTTYNRKNLVLNALKSIYNQSFKDYEVIIVDDCSTDNTKVEIKNYIGSDARFKYFKLDENHGCHSYPKNFGINLAKSSYIAFLDDDDEYMSNALSVLYEKIIDLKTDIVYGGFTVIDGDTGKLANGKTFEFSHDLLLKRNFIVMCSVLVKKKSLEAVNGFDEKVSRFSDWHLWLRIEQAGYKFESIPDQVSIVRINGKDSMTRKYDIYTDEKGNNITDPYFDMGKFQNFPRKKTITSISKSVANSFLVSIVIPVFNRPDLTKVCLDSILKYTSYPFELILVQEGDDPEVTKLLKTYDATFVHNIVPKGFAGAMNTGFELSKGSHICFLNNDIVAIPNWLTYMMEAFKQDSKVGLVTPTYTETKSKQNIDYNKKKEVFTYVQDPMSLKGVCFLISREALDKVGIWDESFGRGGGEDNDICIRISKAGYRLVIARKSFIYHYGSAAFRKLFDNDIPYSKKYAAGQFQKVRKKWNVGGDVPRVQIAIPCKDGWVWHELCLRLTQWSHSQTFKMGYKFYPFLVPHDNARNTAVKIFLEDFWDYLVFIDDDIIPPVETIDELLKADKDIIAPTCLTIRSDDNNMTFPMPVAHRYDEYRQYRPYYGKGIEETDTITGGMFMVKREVYERIEKPFYFTYHRDGIVEYSEDFIFAQQCQSLGYKLYTHYGIICEHMKTIGVKSFNDALVATENRRRIENRAKGPNFEEMEMLRNGIPSKRAMGKIK